MISDIKKFKIEDCRPGFLGHWIFYMIGALNDVKEFKKEKINVCFDNENFTIIQKQTFEILKNRINVVPKDENFIFIPAVKTRTSLWSYFKKINYEIIFEKIKPESIKNYIFFFKLLFKKIFLNDDAFIEKKYFIFLRKLFSEEIKDLNIQGFDKIFIKREGSEKNDGNVADGKLKRRQILNENEIANVVTKFGYKVIQLENYDLKDKIKIFFNAKSIMGANGGGMAFLFMSKPGTKYIEIAPKEPHQWIDHYKQMSKLFQFKFYRYDDVKKVDEFDNMIVDPEKFKIYLKNII